MSRDRLRRVDYRPGISIRDPKLALDSRKLGCYGAGNLVSGPAPPRCPGQPPLPLLDSDL
jgi:hypothetical protein